MNIKSIIILTFLLITGVVMSQNTSDSISVFEKVEIETKSGKLIKLNDVSIVNDTTLSFLDKQTIQYSTMDISQVKNIWKKDGNLVVEYAIIGGTVGLFSSLLALLWANAENENPIPFKVAFPVTAGFTIGAAGIGAVVGLFCPKYTKLNLSKSSKAETIYIKPTINNQEYGFGMVYQF
jgi:hypothetical protein